MVRHLPRDRSHRGKPARQLRDDDVEQLHGVGVSLHVEGPERLEYHARRQRADLVLWDGDPLDVSSLATQVWIGGEAQPMVSRQTLLRDRYAPKR